MTAGRIAIALALAAVVPSTAAAQFTTFVAPAKRADTVVMRDSTVVTAATSADSAARSTIANMKAWVDSAAGDGIDLRARTETRQVTTSTGTVATFENGSPAPNTATPLPLLLTVGAGALGVGALLLRRR